MTLMEIMEAAREGRVRALYIRGDNPLVNVPGGTLMEKALKSIRCTPVKERQCFECHIPPHSNNNLYFRADDIQTCARCHVRQHKVAHPQGPDVKDPRNGQPITCITCHSMHASKAQFMLIYDGKRQLCIQCHKKYTILKSL